MDGSVVVVDSRQILDGGGGGVEHQVFIFPEQAPIDSAPPDLADIAPPFSGVVVDPGTGDGTDAALYM